MSWLVMLWTSLITVRSSIADAAKEVYVDRTDVVEGMLVRENMLDVNDLVWKLYLWTSLLGELQNLGRGLLL